MSVLDYYIDTHQEDLHKEYDYNPPKTGSRTRSEKSPYYEIAIGPNETSMNVTPPKGYLVDEDKSTFEKIVFKRMIMTWKDLKSIEGFYIDNDSKIHRVTYSQGTDENKNTWPSEEEAEAALALSQLCHWRDKYNNRWKPYYPSTSKMHYYIYFNEDRLETGQHPTLHHVLNFKTPNIRKQFIEDFKELIEIAKPLL